MDLIANLALGLQSALSFTHLLYCLAGVSIGTVNRFIRMSKQEDPIPTNEEYDYDIDTSREEAV